jgi:hypothetical protein
LYVFSFYGHAGLMGTAFLLMAVGVAVSRFAKRQRGWLNKHRFLGLCGAASAVIGLVFAVVMITTTGRAHFGSPHTYLGAATLLISIVTPSLGFAQFRYRKMAALIRTGHRWSGRATLTMMLITLMTGLSLAGIL